MRASCWVAFLFLVASCGDNLRPAADAGTSDPDSEEFHLCGNLLVEPTEQCDDGNDDSDDGCSATCQLECGDGQVTGAELCDDAIDPREVGGCPTEDTCVATDACETAIVSGPECAITCELAVTTALIDGDGCCPEGADMTSDSDCVATCGNGVREVGEACDTAIAAGMADACPTTCNDGQNCTTDQLVGTGCDARCTTAPITAIGPADTCCPTDALPTTDPDCVGCGDGDVTGTETCDTGISSGVGSCPVACNDGLACTLDTLVNAGTCAAACTTSPIGPGAMDSCCPVGSDLGDDPDCAPSCGDGVITAPETCDDNGTTGGDGCSATCRIEPIGFRFTDLDLMDPHVFANPFICLDVTNLDAFGVKGVNPLLQTNIQTDEDADGELDLSLTNTFAPLNQIAAMTTPSDLTFPDCTGPFATPSCTLAAGAPHIPATATNRAAGMTCLAPTAGTTGGYSPAIVSSIAPTGGTCYSADAGTVTISLGGIPITLTGAKIGGEWFGSPATEIRDGLLSGFMSEVAANATIIPEGTTGQASIDGHSLASLLKGGTGSCQAGNDKETVDGVVGWMFYLNFRAVKATYSEL